VKQIAVTKKQNMSPKLRIDLTDIKKCLIRDKYLYLMLIPFILWYLVFSYRPMLGLRIAFMDYSPFKGIKGSEWSGLENFRLFISGPYFKRNLINTLMINLYGLIFNFPVPIMLALLLNEVRHSFFKKTVQTMTYLPHFISIVVVAGMVTNLLAPTNGLINILIDKFGGEKIYFLTKPEYFRAIYTGMHMWKEAGFSAIIYVSALSGVDQELYEAAVIDGANRWKQTLHITLPGIMTTIIIMFILKIGRMLEVGYEAIILLYQPATYETADVISTYVYRSGLQEGRYGLATAVGLFNSVIALALVYIANKISNKVSETGLW
jgi:putative aldouronate transport system permease protein